MTSKSQQMRDKHDLGMTIAEIAKEMNCNYSFCYGIIQKHTSKLGLEMNKTVKGSKSTTIRTMYDEGSTIGDIAKELNTNYSYVWTVVEKHRSTVE